MEVQLSLISGPVLLRPYTLDDAVMFSLIPEDLPGLTG